MTTIKFSNFNNSNNIYNTKITQTNTSASRLNNTNADIYETNPIEQLLQNEDINNVIKEERKKLSDIILTNEINVEEVKKNIDKFCFNKQSNLFESNIKMSFETNIDLDGDGKIDCAVIKPEPFDENAKHPMIVYLHGAGGNYNPEDQGAIKGLLESDLQGFNGIILCPLVKGANWAGSNSNKVIKLTQNAIEKYNIDEDMVTLMGHSAGATGSLYIAQKSDLFKSVAVISPAKENCGKKLNNVSLADLNIPVNIYSGDKELDECFKNANKFADKNLMDVKIVSGATHGNVATELMYIDSDNNGCADILEELYNFK